MRDKKKSSTWPFMEKSTHISVVQDDDPDYIPVPETDIESQGDISEIIPLQENCFPSRYLCFSVWYNLANFSSTT